MDRHAKSTVLALVALGNFAQVGSRLVISPVVPAIIETFATSTGAVGLALTGMWAVYALMQFPSGVFGERFGKRVVVLTALTLMAVGSVLLAVAPTFLVFGIVALFLGVGTGLYFPLAVTLVSELFDRRGRALGVLTAGGAFAGLVAPIVGALLGNRYGWRVAVLFGAAVAVPAFVMFIGYVDPPGDVEGDRDRDRVSIARVIGLLSGRRLAYTTVVAATGTFAFQAITSFLPTFLVEFHGLSTEVAGTAFGVLFLLSTVAQPVMGNLADRVPRDAVLAGTMVTTASGLVVLSSGPTRLAVVLGVGSVGIGLSWFPAIMDRFMSALAAADRDIGFGLVRTLYMLVGSVGSVVTGTIAETAGWPIAYLLVAGLLGVAAATLVANRLLRAGI